MTIVTVECLRCGERHELVRELAKALHQGECPRCGYVGWAESEALTEPARQELRDRPIETRRSYAV